MAARPTDTPNWATGGAALITTPPDPTRVSGWIPAVKPPAEFFNWWMNLVYQWILYLSSGGVFDDLEEANDELAIGELATVFEDDNNTGPGVATITKDTGVIVSTVLTGDVDACGALVILGNGDQHPRALLRDLEGAELIETPVATYTRSFTGAGNEVSRVRTDGEITLVAYGTRLQAFNALTGASLWLHDHGGTTVIDFCMSANRVYIVSSQTNGTGDTVNQRHVHALNKTTGAVVWTYRHSTAGSLVGVATNGRQVFITGAASTFASGATTRALRATDGADFDNEGGTTTTDDDGLAWNTVEAVTAQTQCMSSDGQYVYIGYSSASATQLRVIGHADGDLAWSYADPDPGASALCVGADQDYAYMSTNNAGEGFLKAFNKATGTIIWQWGDKNVTPNHCAVVSFASDGQAIFALALTEQRLWRVTRGNVPMRARKVDPDVEFVRYRNWVLQPEAQ